MFGVIWISENMVGTVQPQLKVPNVVDNPDGWGPLEGFVMLENQLQNVPYAPFSKNERIGRVVDWTCKYNAWPNARSGKESSVFDFVFDEADEESFRLVDGKPPPNPIFGPRWRFQQQRHLLSNMRVRYTRVNGRGLTVLGGI